MARIELLSWPEIERYCTAMGIFILKEDLKKRRWNFH